MAGEQDALRPKLQRNKLGVAEARPARLVVRRRHAEAFEPHRVTMRLWQTGLRFRFASASATQADKSESDKKRRCDRRGSSLFSHQPGADLPRRWESELRLALACRSRSTRRRSTILRAGPPPLSDGAATSRPHGPPSHRVQTASPKLSGLVHRRLPIGDEVSIARVARGWIDFGADVGVAGFLREMWGIDIGFRSAGALRFTFPRTAPPFPAACSAASCRGVHRPSAPPRAPGACA